MTLVSEPSQLTSMSSLWRSVAVGSLVETPKTMPLPSSIGIARPSWMLERSSSHHQTRSPSASRMAAALVAERKVVTMKPPVSAGSPETLRPGRTLGGLSVATTVPPEEPSLSTSKT